MNMVLISETYMLSFYVLFAPLGDKSRGTTIIEIKSMIEQFFALLTG